MKFNEAIEKLIENPKDVYELFSSGKRHELLVTDNGYFDFRTFSNGKELCRSQSGAWFGGNISVSGDWEKVRKEVTFMEAFTAWQKGEFITIDRSDPRGWDIPTKGVYQKEQGNMNNPWWYANDIAFGKWFID